MTALFPVGGDPGEVIRGGWTNLTLGWGLAVMFGVYTAKYSGAHINPAVTLAFACGDGFPWRKVLPYWLAQLAGAFVAAALVYLNYRPAFLEQDPGLEKTHNLFATVPAFPDQPFYGFLDQIIGTAVLMFLIMAVLQHAPEWLQPGLIGLIVVAIGMCFGAMHGYAINPARDFGPRLWTVVAGFPNNGLTDGSNVFIVPIVGPLVGGPLGVILYKWCLRPAFTGK